jgi:hypothetical protein|tara:strand:- start:6364 stop:6525 length:162 start_codon:yes stop_codon:yes gene_type:complete
MLDERSPASRRGFFVFSHPHRVARRTRALRAQSNTRYSSSNRLFHLMPVKETS